MRGTCIMSAAITDICPDFFAFWDQAHDAPVEEQWRLWQQLYEGRHRDIFASYYHEFPWARERSRAERAFQRYRDVLPRVRPLMPQSAALIEQTAAGCVDLLDAPRRALPCVVMIGLFISDGWSTTFRGERTSFIALEYAHEPRYLEILLAHEAAHSYHARCHADVWRRHHIGEALFLEGFATLISSEVVPGATVAEYLCFGPGHEAWLTACERQWPAICQQVLRDFDCTEPARFATYFQERGDSALPPRSGYYAGYQAVRALRQRHAPGEMARWDLAHAAEQLRALLPHL